MVVGLIIFHVLHTCLFPPNNMLSEKKNKTHALLPHFCRVSFEALFNSLFFSGSVFVLGEAFLLPESYF